MTTPAPLESPKNMPMSMLMTGPTVPTAESLVADIVADNPCIDRVVELLENVADEKRKRECDEVAEDAALRHIHIALIFLLQDAEFRHNNITCN